MIPKSLRENLNSTTIALSILSHYFGHAPYNTEYFPAEMLNDLNEISSYTNDAFCWFIGQIIRNALKLNQNSIEYLDMKQAELQLKKPFLG